MSKTAVNIFIFLFLGCSCVLAEDKKAKALIDQYMESWVAKPSWWWSIRFGQSTIVEGVLKPIDGDVGLMVDSGDRKMKFEKLNLEISSLVWCEQEVFANSKITNFLAGGQVEKFTVYRELVRDNDEWRSPTKITSDKRYYVLQLDRIFGGDFIYGHEIELKDEAQAIEAISERNQKQPQWESLFISSSFDRMK